MSDRILLVAMIVIAALNAGLYAENVNAGAAVLCGFVALDLIAKVRA